MYREITPFEKMHTKILIVGISGLLDDLFFFLWFPKFKFVFVFFLYTALYFPWEKTFERIHFI